MPLPPPVYGGPLHRQPLSHLGNAHHLQRRLVALRPRPLHRVHTCADYLHRHPTAPVPSDRLAHMEWVEITHPSLTGQTARVSLRSFVEVWQPRGWEIADGGGPPPEVEQELSDDPEQED